MATADISKQAVFDQRIIQNPARFAVDKGALSLTNAPYNAIAATSSQMTFNINVPSQNVFVDRAIDWAAELCLQLPVYIPTTAGAITGLAASAQPAVNVAQAVLVPGRDFSLSAFPLNQTVATMTATINDTSVVINSDTVLNEVLRLTDYKPNRVPRTCPTMLDRYGSYNDERAAGNATTNDFSAVYDQDLAPNGAWGDVVFTDPTGVPLDPTAGTAAAPAIAYTIGGVDYYHVRGVPIRFWGGAAGGVSRAEVAGPVANTVYYPLFIKFRSVEKLILSPFIFANACEWETGLFGINNIQLVFNFKSSPARSIRNDSLSGSRVVGQFAANGLPISYGANPWLGNPRVNVQYLTPSLDVPLPAKSVVPYMEFPRYLQRYTTPIEAGASTVLNSQTIVLPQIPDMLIMYCKPTNQTAAAGNASVADFYLPITNISLNFDNFAGLLSSHTAEQLYSMAVHNGLEMNYEMWSGKANFPNYAASGQIVDAAAGVLASRTTVQTVGGFLVLKPGQDFALQSGQAPSLIGNFTLQFNPTIYNSSGVQQTDYTLYVIAVNSGFFETLAGSSRIIKGVLSEADIISAEPIAEGSRDGLKRIVGAGFFSSLGSILSKAKDIYAATKPAVSAIKGMLPEGKIKDIMGKVGYGMAGAGMAGAGMAGAGKKSLSARLM